MITPLTILSSSQGLLKKQPQSEAAYWDRRNDDRPHQPRRFWHAFKIDLSRLPHRRRADQQ
jgi:hypothetical protein